MATKKCPNGHQYDSSIYGDNCPFCPQSGHTQVNMPGIRAPTAKTEINNNFNGNGTPGATAPTTPYYPGMPDVQAVAADTPSFAPSDSPARPILTAAANWWACSLATVTIPQGRSTRFTRAATSWAVTTLATSVSRWTTRCRAAICSFSTARRRASCGPTMKNSSNGTYINGKFTGDRTELHTNDIIVIGSTKLVFLGVPEF